MSKNSYRDGLRDRRILPSNIIRDKKVETVSITLEKDKFPKKKKGVKGAN